METGKTAGASSLLRPPGGGTSGQRAADGVAFGLATTVIATVAQLGFMVVMARLLPPSAFGVMAMALVAYRAVALVAQWGVGPALMQCASLPQSGIGAALALTWGVNLIATAVLWGLAPLVGSAFGNEAVVPVLQLLAPGLLLGGLGALSMALLRRAQRFRTAALIDLLAYIIGYGGVGMVVALQGGAVLALVAATLAQSLLGWLGAWVCLRHSLWPSWPGKGLALFGYGGRHTVVSVVEFAGANLDAAVVGRLLGDAALGLYSRALLLATLPAEKLSGAVSRVLLPLLSTVQGDALTLRAAVMFTMAAVGLASGALGLGVAGAAEQVVGVLLGVTWMDAVPILQVLAWVAPAMFMSHVCGIACDAAALLRLKLQVQLAALALLLGLSLAWADEGALGVARALLLSEWLRWMAYLVMLGRRWHWPAGEVLRLMAAVAVGSLLVLAAVRLCAAGLSAHLPALGVLGAQVVAGSLALLLGARWALALLEPTGAGKLAARQLPQLGRWLGVEPGRGG